MVELIFKFVYKFSVPQFIRVRFTLLQELMFIVYRLGQFSKYMLPSHPANVIYSRLVRFSKFGISVELFIVRLLTDVGIYPSPVVLILLIVADCK